MTAVGLLEPSYHRALIPPLATIAHKATSDVTVFTTEENHEHATAAMDDDVAESCAWVVKAEDESFQSFFEQVERATAEFDVFWTITPYGPPEVAEELLTFAPRCPAITHLHASSRFVAPKHQLCSEMFTYFIQSFGSYLPAPIRGRSWNQLGTYLAHHILDNYDCVLPLYPPITKYVEEIIEPDALVDWFLPEFHQPGTTINHDRLQITIPGRVSTSLRNYDLLFDVLDGMSGAPEELRLSILGRATDESGEQVIERCERYEQSGYDIQYYPSGEWIPADEFKDQMNQTNLIFAPINTIRENYCYNHDRIKGRTATSGAIGDAVRIGRPLVMPEEFTVAPEFEELITTYESSTDATALIESWVASETTRRELKQRAESAAQQFSLENQATRFESLCRRTIEADGQ